MGSSQLQPEPNDQLAAVFWAFSKSAEKSAAFGPPVAHTGARAGPAPGVAAGCSIWVARTALSTCPHSAVVIPYAEVLARLVQPWMSATARSE